MKTTTKTGSTPDHVEPTPIPRHTTGPDRETAPPTGRTTDTAGRAIWIGIALVLAAAVSILVMGQSGDDANANGAVTADRVLIESSERLATDASARDANANGAVTADRVLRESRPGTRPDSEATSADRVLLQSHDGGATDNGASSADRVLRQTASRTGGE